MIKRCFAAALVGVALLGSSNAGADPRPFTFVYDTYNVGKGNFEFEQWVTWGTHKADEHGYDRFDFREEIEFGITDYFDLGLYLPNWRYEDSNEKKGASYQGVSVEGIVYLSKPTDLVGVGLYGEVTVGESGREFEFEQKLLLHKDIGPWTLAYNLIFETEIEREDGENEVEGVIGHAFGVSYSVSPRLRVGAELTVESIYEDWSKYEHTEVYAGPNFHYNGGRIAGTKSEWWITVTPMFQLSDLDDEPDFLLRMIAGVTF